MITVSIVSHAHGEMVSNLTDTVLSFPEVSQVIVTLNVYEEINLSRDPKLTIVSNIVPKGYGKNHNYAFSLARGNFFCVMNPDVIIRSNPFPKLLEEFNDDAVGLAAPMVINDSGSIEDSMRHFITPWSLLKRVLGLESDAYSLACNSSSIFPDWVAGMFMLIRKKAYDEIMGFDERYFMYCEDVDLCTRLWKAKYKVVGCTSAVITHDAQRSSHANIKFFIWHVFSLIRYFLYRCTFCSFRFFRKLWFMN
jgi:N-acetylglucosaminyl-diphospho-decaprenol L-rhamnosyltransferase